MERHGHDQPPFHHLQQPDPRRAAGTAIRGVSRPRILSVLCRKRPADLGARSTAMSDRRNVAMKKIMFAAIMVVAAAIPARAASEADFKAAFAAADSAEK